MLYASQKDIKLKVLVFGLKLRKEPEAFQHHPTTEQTEVASVVQGSHEQVPKVKISLFSPITQTNNDQICHRK